MAVSEPGSAEPVASAHPSLTAFTGRIGRHGSIFGAGSAATVLVSLVSLAVLTRFLDPAEFGRLAVLLIFAAFLTVLFNLGSLQGSLIWVFGTAGEEEDGDSRAAPVGDKRRALGTALVFTTGIAVGAGALLIPLADSLSDALLGEPGHGDLVMLAVASGSSGAVWRLVQNVPRLERRPVVFVLLGVLRPMAVLGIAVPLVASGGGAEGVLTGTAAGTLFSIVVAVAVTRRSYAIAFMPGAFTRIMRAGSVYVPVIVSFWIVQNADLFMLSRYAGDADVGVYRVASRVGSLASYAVSVFFLAWMPLRRSAAYFAAQKEQGRLELGSATVTYFALACLWLLLAVYVCSDVLVRIAPSSYSDAAPLVPLIAAAFILNGLFVLVYRVSAFRGRRRAYISLACVGAVLFVGLSLVMVPRWEGTGAALAAIVAMGAICLGMGALAQRGAQRLRFQYRRLGSGALAAALPVGALLATEPHVGGGLRIGLDAIALLSYPLLLFLLRALPLEHLGPLARSLRLAVPQRGERAAVLDRLAELQPERRAELEVLIRHGQSAGEIAALVGTSEEEIQARAVAALRSVAGVGEPRGSDARLGGYLFSGGPAAERDAIGHQLWADGIDPGEADRLEGLVAILRTLRPAQWNGVSEGRGQALRRIG